MNDLFTNGATGRLEICTDHRSFNPDCPRCERERAIVRRDAKRDLRRRLPDAARPLVTLAERLDDIAADVRSGWQYPEHSADRISDAADTIREALAQLADNTDR